MITEKAIEKAVYEKKLLKTKKGEGNVSFSQDLQMMVGERLYYKDV